MFYGNCLWQSRYFRFVSIVCRLGVDIGFLFYGLVYYVSMVDRDLCRTVYLVTVAASAKEDMAPKNISGRTTTTNYKEIFLCCCFDIHVLK